MSSFLNKASFTRVVLSWVAFFLILPPGIIRSQHNGDPLFFQGLANPNPVGVKGLAYGNAFTSRTGDLNSLYYNVSGLANIRSLQASISSKITRSLERDNQVFYPGGDYLNTSLYLERLWIPDPSWNNLWSDSLGIVWYDSLGNPYGTYWNTDRVKPPVQGKDDYSKEAADHEKKSKGFDFDQFSVALPFQFAGKSLVAAASIFRQYDIRDYDWNGVHLEPHWGTSTIIQADKGDTTRTNWSVFTRERTGGVYSIAGALAVQWSRHFQMGLRLNRFSGKTQDRQILDRVGYFLTIHQGSKWAFSYDTSKTRIEGSSRFSAWNLNVGALFVSDNVDLGLNIQIPYTIQRKWDISKHIVDSEHTAPLHASGVDKVRMPAIYTLGMTLKPAKALMLSFDFESTRLNQAKYDPDQDQQDTLTFHTKWVNRIAYRFGVEYRLTQNLAFLGGYQSQSASFVPYGVAIRDQGPPGEGYSFGLSLNVPHGRIDLAYTIDQLKYYDAYITNRNFTLEETKRLSFGYTVFL